MNRKAFLVGINDYAPIGSGGPDLRGCVNDVRDMVHTLNALGIVPARPANMRIATDARATKNCILDGFKWLVHGAKKGDVLIFYYSGHGSQVLDMDGGREEPDGKDETICPHDFATAGMIKDDDFRKLMTGLQSGVNLDVIFDSCHSGTGTREMVTRDTEGEEQVLVFRYIESPLDWGSEFLSMYPELPLRGILRAEPSEGEKETVLVPGLNHVLWAGCRNYQTSAETTLDGTVRGVFTYCFCKTLRRAGMTITRRRLDSLVSAYINKLGYKQVPQLEGARDSLDQKVFT